MMINQAPIHLQHQSPRYDNFSAMTYQPMIYDEIAMLQINITTLKQVWELIGVVE
jgi:hypothetical protein